MRSRFNDLPDYVEAAFQTKTLQEGEENAINKQMFQPKQAHMSLTG